MANELEYVEGYIYANVFQQNDILKIRAADGLIEKRINFGLLSAIQEESIKGIRQTYYDRVNNVLNGLAYDPKEDAWYATGKRWNFIFKLRLK